MATNDNLTDHSRPVYTLDLTSGKPIVIGDPHREKRSKPSRKKWRTSGIQEDTEYAVLMLRRCLRRSAQEQNPA